MHPDENNSKTMKTETFGNMPSHWLNELHCAKYLFSENWLTLAFLFNRVIVVTVTEPSCFLGPVFL